MSVMPSPCVHFVVPGSVDDPACPSGGNMYDLRMCSELEAIGWTVRKHPVAGRWPRPDAAARAGLERTLADVPGGAAVLIDGLIASTGIPDAEQRRLRLIVLVHMPLGGNTPDGDSGSGDDAGRRGARAGGDDREGVERGVLSAAAAVVTTSAWTRDVLVRSYGLAPRRVHVVRPGVDAGPAVAGSDGAGPAAARSGGNLLVVGAVTYVKGHDVLVAALAEIADLSWRCVCVGASDMDPDYVDSVHAAARTARISSHLRLTGVRSPGELDTAYAEADVLVLCSRYETYGMVVTEALARGIPVIAADVGGVHEALGTTGKGAPGVLVPPEDPVALATELRAWLGDARRRSRLRRAAAERAHTLDGWPAAGSRLSEIVAGVLA